MHEHILGLLPENGNKLRAVCTCGWRSDYLDKTKRGATQAWEAHMYAQGYKTKAAIETASLPARGHEIPEVLGG